ncbi:MAG TPA: SusF/SusE family outer membrane protein [Bacteroidales bacterium]|nr:SusF/SusE family outer membrane protein [Bacteroidales bacterium]HPT03418.1 SusF/SusE family outer membrane protein [Bacteroidales bacterium]
MKRYTCIAFCLSVLALVTGCKKDDLAELNKGNTPLELTLSNQSLTLNEKQRDNVILTMNWTSGSNMGSNAAITYKLLIDKAGNNFSNPLTFDLGKTTYKYEFTAKTLNALVRDSLGVEAGDEISLEAEVIATILSEDVEPQVSPLVSFKVTPYDPVSENLYIYGNATEAGWDNTKAVALTPVEGEPGGFAWQGQLSAGDFEFLTVLGQDFPSYVKGNTAAEIKLRTSASQPDNRWHADAPGVYKIAVNLLDLTISVTKMPGPDYSQIFMVGSAAPNGWDISNATELVQNPDNLYEFTYTGVMNAGEFKFPVNRSSSWGQDMYMRLDDTHMYLHHGGDPDDNKWTIDKKGYYTITLNLLDLTIKIDRLQLYMVGSATPIGWDISNAVQMTEDNSNGCIFRYSGPMVAGEFKLPVNRNSDWGQDMYMKVDDTHMYRHHGGDSDDNKWTLTEDGNYTIVANVEDLTISIQKR